MDCGEITYYENEDNAWIQPFAQGVSQIPLVGGAVAGLIQPSYSAARLRCVPGNMYDERTPWTLQRNLIVTAAILIAVYFLILPRL